MTENEAKQVLDNIWDFVTPEDDCLGDFVENALYVVDSIFEEIQEYRAIGTVEEFKALKEKEERFDRNIRMFNEIGLEIRAKAIDEFAEHMKEEAMARTFAMRCCDIDKIAEQLKAGGVNE